MGYTRDFVARFGFDKSQVPDDLTMALGTASLSPLQMVTGYSTFANGGFKVTPYYIDRIEDGSGKTLVQADPAIACPECGRVTDPPAQTGAAAASSATSSAAGAVTGGSSSGAKAPSANAKASLLDDGPHDGKTVLPAKNLAPQVLRPQVAYLLADMMLDVIRRGTGVSARVLNRDDIAGKTGTTNEQHDAWFNGFNGDLVTTVWTGFDQDRTLGSGEEGARAALPTWIFYMHDALAHVPRHWVPVPDGIVTVRISPETGQLASADNPNRHHGKIHRGQFAQGGDLRRTSHTESNDGRR